MADTNKQFSSEKRILLAEDNDISASLITELFRADGISVDRAENGLAALEAIKNSAYGAYKMILMDINMPKLNGLEAASAIRRLGRPDTACIPIIGITADYPYQNKTEEDRFHGITDFIAKPIDRNSFRKIKDYLFSDR